jgi:3-oxoacyl-[acyl-carrier protein] reductase
VRLQGRIALVTGAGSGIGRAIALRFAAEGATVVVNDLTHARAQQTVDAIATAGGPAARAAEADVSDSSAVRKMFGEVESAFGRLDVLVNNAGIGSSGAVRPDMQEVQQARMAERISGEGITTHWDLTERMTDEIWHRMIGVHLNGTFFCTREALRLMHGGGAIVNLSSVAALMGLETVPHYSAAKAGILGFTRAVAQEVGSRGIRVNAICPGFVETPMTDPISAMGKRLLVARTPLGRIGQPEEIAATALFLACDDGSFVTGQWLSPNGGLFIG